MPDCGTVTGQRFKETARQPNGLAVAPDDGMANWPFGSRAFRMASATGLTVAALAMPNAAASPAAVRFVSVKPSGMFGDVRLFIKE